MIDNSISERKIMKSKQYTHTNTKMQSDPNPNHNPMQSDFYAFYKHKNQQNLLMLKCFNFLPMMRLKGL